MFFERELLKRIPQYEKEGILDEASAERLTARLQESVGEKLFFSRAIYVAGIVLLLASAFLFVRNIWDGLSVSFRLGLAFAPLVMSVAFSIGTVLKNGGSLFKETAAVANVLSFCVMLIVIAKTLNLPENYHGFIVCVMLFCAMMMLLFGSYALSGGLAVTLATFAYGNYYKYIDLPLMLILFALVLSFTFYGWRKAKLFQTIAGFFVLISFGSSIFGIVDNFVKYPLIGSRLLGDFPYAFSDFYLCAVYGVCAILLLLFARGRFSNLRFWQMPQLYVGLFSMFAASSVINFGANAKRIAAMKEVLGFSLESVYILAVVVGVVSLGYLLTLGWAMFARKKNWGAIILR